MKLTRKISIIVTAVIVSGMILTGCGTLREQSSNANSSKHPSQYTWKEYLALNDEQRLAFEKSFRTPEVFAEWVEYAQNEDKDFALVLPWESGGKQPAEYTWEEFEELSAAQQMAFQNSFENLEAFDVWLQGNLPQETETVPDLPWEDGEKQPEDYTWEEFEALTAAQQTLFQKTFESMDAFDAWLQNAQEESSELPWENGGKQPQDYTLEEYEALPEDQKAAFQNSFTSMGAFEEWLFDVQNPEKEEQSNLPWVNGGKQPRDYTWEEFEALTASQQMAFQNSFESMAAFDDWMQKAQEPASDLPWENGGKQPQDYTWDEFEALTAAQQMTFQNSFGSLEAFDAWLQRVTP